MGGISDLIDSDMENAPGLIDENSILSSASDASFASTSLRSTNSKKTKKRHRVTMPKPKNKVTKASDEPLAKRVTKKTANAKRKALEEQVNGAREEDNIVESVEIEEMPKKTNARSRSRKVQQRAADQHDAMDADQTPVAARSNLAKTKRDVPKVTAKNGTTTNTFHSKSTAPTLDTAEAEPSEDISGLGALPPPRHNSRVRTDVGYRSRGGSMSDTERGDPILRRKLGDITRKFENVDLKYQNLREVGINEANANLEKLRKQCEVTTHASNELIASLKKELALQAPLASDSRKFKKDLQARDAETSELRQRNAELSSNLASAQNEIKAVQAKLAASRSQSVSAEIANSKTPAGSSKPQARIMPTASTEAAQAALSAQMKEDLYSDLTGLIIRGAKRTVEGDTFDCIQTGRNGTLHFKLYIDQEEAKNMSFEETEFLYTPLLDQNRDHELMEIMPEYLTDEITFARQNAAKFYTRVVDTLTRRMVEE